MVIGINEAQEQAAYTTFGFTRQAAQIAYGQVLFLRDPAANPLSVMVIPQGTQVTTSGGALAYVTQGIVTLDAGHTSALISVLAVQAGSAYNIGSNQIINLNGSFPDVLSVTNPQAFITGADIENDFQRRVRFAQYLQGLHRATKQSILFGVKQTTILDGSGFVIERVVKANTIEQSPGLIYVYVHNGVGNTSPSLVAQASSVLYGYTDASNVVHEGWKAAGIIATVFAAQEVVVNVEVAIEIETGRLPAIVALAAEQAVQAYFQTLDVGDICRVESIKQAVRQTPGVLDIVSVANPGSNAVMGVGQIAVPGSITVDVQ
jgi:uncharacterized phage protein gp47/JayE